MTGKPNQSLEPTRVGVPPPLAAQLQRYTENTHAKRHN